MSDESKKVENEVAPETNEENVAAENQSTEPTEKVTPEKEPVAEEPKVEEPVAEEPKVEEPVAEEPVAETPAEEPKTEEPVAEEKPVKADPDPNTGLADFNWEEFAADELESSDDQTEFEKMYSETLSTIAENEVIDGLVISMNKREVVINIGYKSEGVISLSEFRYNPDLKAGDKVEVFVESQEDKKGQLILSHK